MNLHVVQAAFVDELEKIGGAMIRSGRRPIRVSKLLEKGAGLPINSRDAALLAGGALAYHQGRKVKRRYEIGRQVESQNQF